MGRSRSKDRYNSRSRSNGKSYEKGISKQIFVTRISKRTSSQDLRDVFRKYGHIRNVSMKRSYAFIEFSDLSDASLGNIIIIIIIFLIFLKTQIKFSR